MEIPMWFILIVLAFDGLAGAVWLKGFHHLLRQVQREVLIRYLSIWNQVSHAGSEICLTNRCGRKLENLFGDESLFPPQTMDVDVYVYRYTYIYIHIYIYKYTHTCEFSSSMGA